MTNKDLTFEEKMTLLENLVSEISSGKLGLEENLKKYNEAQELIKELTTILENAKKSIDK